ncbi:MAG: sugar phosphate isomerase/epimerase [Planctomycetes bacterium]|nr:sugar phosphate isomerase/epimerase [Planctomycetota bacterium]
MKLGLVTYNLAKDWNVDTIIQKCQANGFEGVELRTTHRHGVEVGLTDAERRSMRQKFQDSGVSLCGLGSAFEYHAMDPAEVRRNIEGTKEYVLLARDVGAPGVKVRPNGVHTDKGVPLEKTLEQIGLACRECAAFAVNEGVAIRLEVHGRVTCEVPNIRTILDAGRHPNLYACWNSNHGETVDGSIRKNFDLLKDRIGLVHMRDIGVPDYPWFELVSLLRGIGYRGFCCAEIAESPEPDRLMKYYSSLWRAYNQPAKGA